MFQTPAAKRRASRLRDDLSANLLDVSLEQEDEEQALGDLIDRELKIRRRPTIKKNVGSSLFFSVVVLISGLLKRMYKLRERENTIYASSDDKVSHMSQAGDIDNGKAWRTVRRPSDMASHCFCCFEMNGFEGSLTNKQTRMNIRVRLRSIGLNINLVRDMERFL